MTALGITTVPLPAFWSSSKYEVAPVRRSPRKLHLCHNPRCAANTAGYTTAHKEPPAKLIKAHSKNTTSKSVSLVSSDGTPTEFANSRSNSHRKPGTCPDCNAPFAPSTKPLRDVSTGNNSIGSTGMTSKKSTTPASPSISTPTRSNMKTKTIAQAQQSFQKRSNTRSSTPVACLRRTQTATSGTIQNVPVYPRSERQNRGDINEHLVEICNSPQGGRVAPPPSERDEEEHPLEQRNRRHKSKTIAPFHGSPQETAFMCPSPWPPNSPTDVGLPSRVKTLAPNHSTSNWVSSLSPDRTTPLPALVQHTNDNGCREAEMLSPACNLSKTFKASRIHRETPIVQTGKSGSTGRTETTARNSGCDVPTGLSAMAATGNLSKISRMEQSVGEDNRSIVSDASNLTVSSDAHVHEQTLGQTCSTKFCTTCGKNKEQSYSKELCNTCGKKPVSAFYNALYAPDCSINETKQSEFDLHTCSLHSSERKKFRVAIEIAILSVLVTVLVAVFSPLVIPGLRSQLYGCCSCPASPGTMTSQQPSQHNSDLMPYNSWAFQGVRNLLKCPLAKPVLGSTALK